MLSLFVQRTVLYMYMYNQITTPASVDFGREMNMSVPKKMHGVHSGDNWSRKGYWIGVPERYT